MLFSISLFAREEMFLPEAFPVLNHMKHTQNTDDVHLDTRLGFE